MNINKAAQTCGFVDVFVWGLRRDLRAAEGRLLALAQNTEIDRVLDPASGANGVAGAYLDTGGRLGGKDEETRKQGSKFVSRQRLRRSR